MLRRSSLCNLLRSHSQMQLFRLSIALVVLALGVASTSTQMPTGLRNDMVASSLKDEVGRLGYVVENRFNNVDLSSSFELFSKTVTDAIDSEKGVTLGVYGTTVKTFIESAQRDEPTVLSEAAEVTKTWPSPYYSFSPYAPVQS